jgi:thymidylate synthase
MKIYSNNTFASSYNHLLSDLMSIEAANNSARSLPTREIIDGCIELHDPINCMYLNNARSSQFRYIAAEFMWYFLGRNDVDFIKEYAKFWLQIQNPDGTVNSSYGNLIFNIKNSHGYTQYAWALNSLLKDKNTRQAVLHFNSADHQYDSNKDFVCTMYANFLIRDNKLRMSVKMRSNDVILGLPTDVAFFTVLQQQILSHLRKLKYPDLELGTYTHIVDSLHVYERHYGLVERMLDEDFINVQMPTLYSDLIDLTGTPSINLLEIGESKENDDLLMWIHENMKIKKDVKAVQK